MKKNPLTSLHQPLTIPQISHNAQIPKPKPRLRRLQIPFIQPLRQPNRLLRSPLRRRRQRGAADLGIIAEREDVIQGCCYRG